MNCYHPGVAGVLFDTKIIVVLREDLPAWQQLNMTAFLCSGVAASAPEAIGRPYADADGTEYLALFRQPVLVFAADSAGLARTLDRALSRGTTPAVFTEGMFDTGHDDANRAVVAAASRDSLPLTGLALRAERRIADKITRGLKLHD